MFEFIVSNFWGAVQMVGLLHGISVLVEKTGKMVGLLHGIGVLVENIGKMVGLLHGIGVLVEKTGKMVGLLVTELGISVDK